MWLAQILVLALVALALGLFVVRPILKSASLPAPDGRFALTKAEAEDERAGSARAAIAAASENGAGRTSDVGRGPGDDWSAAEDDPVARLRRLIEERQDETVEILRNWMEEGEERV
jgi:flagellar M-ring protein FliF